MERREIVICGLAEACRESERLSGVTAKDRWEIVRYETAERSGTGIALWDAYPKRVTRLSEWYVTSRLGSPEHIGELNRGNTPYRRLIKILSWNGEDMSLYNPSWRG